MPVARRSGEVREARLLALVRFEDDEVVTCTVHLGKVHDEGILSSASGKAKHLAGINNSRSALRGR
jgi:hypothetical protein